MSPFISDKQTSSNDPAAVPPQPFDGSEPSDQNADPNDPTPIGRSATDRISKWNHFWGNVLGFLQSALDKRTLVALSPAAIPIAILPFMLPLMRLEINHPLSGDTYVFQYTGWCINHGLRLYRDIGMADGPFIHFFHALMQRIVGLGERGFRIGDLTCQAVCGAALGLLLTPKVDLQRTARHVHRAIWAGLGMALWLSWYLCMAWQETTEREAYYTIFGTLGMVLIYASPSWKSARHAEIGVAIGAFLTGTQIFGKPTGIAYVGLGALSILVGEATPASTRRMLRAFGLGLAAAVGVTFLALLLWGSIPGYFLWCFKIPWYGNKFLLAIDWHKLLLIQWDIIRLTALASLFGGIAAIASGVLPRSALGLALAPTVFWFGACLQARGFFYQVMPVLGASYTLHLAVLSGLWKESTRRSWAARRGLAAALILTFVGQTCIDNYHKSPFRWSGDPAQWSQKVGEYRPSEQDAGRYIKEHTRPTDRVFAYTEGGDAHVVLYAARRRTASPFFHGFWLDPVDLLSLSEIKPDPQQLADLTALQTEIRRITCTAVEKDPPEAMVFTLLPPVFKICPKIEGMLGTLYEEATTIGAHHVYLRKSVSSR